MARLRYALRAVFLTASLAAPIVLLHQASERGTLERVLAQRPLDVFLTAGLLAGPLLVLAVRELVRVLSPPETSSSVVLLGGRVDEGVSALVATVVRGVLGLGLFGAAAGFGLAVSFVAAIAFGLGAWVVGFAERRLTYVRSARGLFVEGWLVPAWIARDRVASTGVRTTTWRGGGGRERTYCAVVVLTNGTQLEAGPEVHGREAAERDVERAAAALGVPVIEAYAPGDAPRYARAR